MTGPGRGANAVPFALPARYLLLGPAALAGAHLTLALRPGLLLGHVAQPAMLAVVHAITLGFATLVFVGAMHQLLPVLIDARLWSVALGHATFAALAGGAATVVAGFALGYRPWVLGTGGGLVLLALALFLTNVLATARRARRRSPVGHAIVAASAYLLATALLGTWIALARTVPGLAAPLGYATPLHLGLGLFGAFFLAIVGAGHRLLAMFVLTHGVGPARVAWAAGLVHAAMASLALAAFARWPLGWLALALIAAAAALYLVDLGRIVRRRVRRSIERPMRTYLAGAAFLPLAAALALAGRWPAAVAAVLAGFLTLAIAGMLGKIVAFLTWQHRYAARVGFEAVPMLRDMTRPALEAAAGVGLGVGALAWVGVLLWPTAILAGIAAWASLAGSAALLAHLLVIVAVRHRPRSAEAVHAAA